MTLRRTSLFILSLFAVAVVAGPAAAQDEPATEGARGVVTAQAPEPQPEDAYGPSVQQSWVLSTEFAPYASASPWEHNANLYFAKTTGSVDGVYGARVDLPNGALVTAFCAYLYDNDASLTVTVRFRRYAYDTSSNTNTVTTLATIAPSGTPQYSNTCVTLGTAETIRHANGTVRNSYVVEVTLPTSATATVRFRMARLDWQRQVSPAPASATFADVPTTAAYFPHVEALAASGVVTGCGGGNYCPNNPVTRGQMAVFLALALGMHWPQ